MIDYWKSEFNFARKIGALRSCELRTLTKEYETKFQRSVEFKDRKQLKDQLNSLPARTKSVHL